MEWSKVLERHILDLIKLVLNGSHPLAKQSMVFDDFNGWKATIGVNGMTMVLEGNPLEWQWFSMVANH